MKHFILSALAVAAMASSGAVLAQGAEGQAGSAWEGWQVVPGYGAVPPPERTTDPWGRPLYRRYGSTPYAAPYSNVPAYPYGVPDTRTRRDRDGDSVPNRTDRFPDDPSRS